MREAEKVAKEVSSLAFRMLGVLYRKQWLSLTWVVLKYQLPLSE